jgi:hypothetical protein
MGDKRKSTGLVRDGLQHALRRLKGFRRAMERSLKISREKIDSKPRTSDDRAMKGGLPLSRKRSMSSGTMGGNTIAVMTGTSIRRTPLY